MTIFGSQPCTFLLPLKFVLMGIETSTTKKERVVAVIQICYPTTIFRHELKNWTLVLHLSFIYLCRVPRRNNTTCLLLTWTGFCTVKAFMTPNGATL